MTLAGQATAWARDFVREAGREPEVVVTRGESVHLGALLAELPGSVVIAWSDSVDAPQREGRIVRVSSRNDRIGAVLRSLLALGVEVASYNPSDDALVCATPASKFESDLAAWRRAAAVEADTVRTDAASWFQNVDANLETVLGLPAASALAGALDGRATVVVGSDPSCDRFLSSLAEVRNRVAVIATNSSVRPLAQAGVIPDAIVVFEGTDRSRDLDGVPSELFRRSLLLVKASTHPANLDWPFERRAVFLGPSDAWLREWFGRGSLVPTAGNVGTTAIVLAWMLGADPVLVRLPLLSYREQTEQILATISSGDPRTRFVSLSADGERIAGMQSADWPDLRESLPPQPPVDLVRRAAQAVGGGSGCQPEALRRTVVATADTLRTLIADSFGPAIGLAVSAPANTFLRSLVMAEMAALPRSANPEQRRRDAFERGAESLERLARRAAAALGRG